MTKITSMLDISATIKEVAEGKRQFDGELQPPSDWEGLRTLLSDMPLVQVDADKQVYTGQTVKYTHWWLRRKGYSVPSWVDLENDIWRAHDRILMGRVNPVSGIEPCVILDKGYMATGAQHIPQGDEDVRILGAAYGDGLFAVPDEAKDMVRRMFLLDTLSRSESDGLEKWEMAERILNLNYSQARQALQEWLEESDEVCLLEGDPA